MSKSKAQNPTEDLMASLMKELNISPDDPALTSANADVTESHLLSISPDEEQMDVDLASILGAASASTNTESVVVDSNDIDVPTSMLPNIPTMQPPVVELAPVSEKASTTEVTTQEEVASIDEAMSALPQTPVADATQGLNTKSISNDKTIALDSQPVLQPEPAYNSNPVTVSSSVDSEKTVAIAGYSNRADNFANDNVKVSVGQTRGAFSSGYAAWGSPDAQLAQVENLRIAQEKILELEKENEKLRSQNDELIAASEIVRERAELLTSQVQEFKNDRDSLEQSYKNELNLVRNQYNRKDNELQKAQMKIDELDSRLKFDMKKIRIRERELENRLELIRAEKNALVKSKDEQILDLRRKLDQLQLEVESYRQKCVELNKIIDINQDSFKRTTRALRLAMANLELQEENKPTLKKAE